MGCILLRQNFLILAATFEILCATLSRLGGFNLFVNPGRCPGLDCLAPSGLISNVSRGWFSFQLPAKEFQSYQRRENLERDLSYIKHLI